MRDRLEVIERSRRYHLVAGEDFDGVLDTESDDLDRFRRPTTFGEFAETGFSLPYRILEAGSFVAFRLWIAALVLLGVALVRPLLRRPRTIERGR